MITEEEVLEAERKLFSAQLDSNVEVLDHLLYDDLIAVTPTGECVTKQMDLQAHQSKTMVLEHATIQVDEVKITGDMAITIATMKAKGKLLGEPMQGTFKYMRVWKRFDHQLRVVAASILLVSDNISLH